MIFYHSRLADEPTGTIIESLHIIVLVVSEKVANSVKTKVLYKTTPIQRTTVHEAAF